MNSELHFMHPSTLISQESQSWRPPSFPPPDDWVISVDLEGNDLSRYGDAYWDYSAFGFYGFNFGIQGLTEPNLRQVKIALLLALYHPGLFPGKVASCKVFYLCLIRLARACDEQGILVSELSRFPRVFSAVAAALRCSKYGQYITILHKYQIYSDILGFTIADKNLIAFLSSQSELWEVIQHPYIPPRIWSYQVKRLNECIEDFIRHKTNIESAFTWIAEAYEHNASLSIDKKYYSPFNQHRVSMWGQRTLYDGGFECFLKDYKLYDLIERWVSDSRAGVRNFNKYLNLVRDAAIFYILNFSLQRLSEAASLQADCFKIEKDDRLGKIAFVVGETTKTDPDSDARWVVPETVKKAVDAAAFISSLRASHALKRTPKLGVVEEELPLLMLSTEEWARCSKNRTVSKRKMTDYGSFISSYPKVLDQQKITVTEDDWKIALSLTPNLHKKKGFGIGLPWKFSAHQLRRTTNINMFASNMVSDNSLQWQMKHLNRAMALYYGRNHINLRLNSDVETAVIVESYRAVYRQLVAVVEDSFEYVRPHDKEFIPENIINLVEAGEDQKLTKLIKQGVVGCRRTLLGYCMKAGACEYGGIESVAKCAGADGKSICSDAIFERKNASKLIKLKQSLEEKLSDIDQDNPRASAIKQEIYAIEVYLNVIKQ